MELEGDDGYDSIDEDAELELSCALHDLALRVKHFEEDMKGRFTHHGDEDEEEIEEIPEHDECGSPRHLLLSPRAAAKNNSSRNRRSLKFAKEPDEDDQEEANEEEEDDGYEEDEDHEPSRPLQRDEKEWDDRDQTQELSELKQNIALLLQNMKIEAKALDLEAEQEGNQCY